MGDGSDLVTYGANGLRLLTGSEYSTSLSASTNVRLTTSATDASSLNIRSLVLANSGTSILATIARNQTLTLSSGALLSSGTVGNVISGGSITFGYNSATQYEGIIHTVADLTIGSAITNNAGQPVTLTKSGPAQLTLTGNNSYSGATYVGNGALHVAVGGAVIGSGDFTVGGNPAVLTVDGGKIATNATGNVFYLGGVAGQTGEIDVSAGSVVSSNAGGSVILGDFGTGIWNQAGGTTTIAGGLTGANSPGSTAQMNLSGGSIQASGNFLVAQSGTGALNLSGTCGLSTPSLAIVGWTSGFAAGTVNLDGGTLAVGAVAETSSGQIASGTATFNFNGGVLRATASNTAFLQGLDYAYVQSGGAVIDTQGYRDTIGQPLLSYAATGSGGLTKLGTGLLALTASNTYTGLTTVNGGTLQLGDGVNNCGSVAGDILLANGSTLVFANPASMNCAAAITGRGNLVMSGPGELALSGANAYSGTTTINGGLLAFNNAASLPPRSIVTINHGAAMAATSLYTPADWLSSGVIAPGSSGALALTANCDQDLNLQSPTTYALLSLGSSGNNTYSGTLTPVGTTYRLGGGGGTLTMTQPLIGGDNLVVNGPGGVVLANMASLSLSSLQMSSAAGPVSLQLAGAAYSVGSLAVSGTAGASVTLGNSAAGTATTLTLGGDNRSSTFSGAIGDLSAVNAAAIGSLVKTGSGTLVLTGSSTYSGPTVINGGTLKLYGFIPGLYEGMVCTNNSWFDTYSSIPCTSVQTSARWGDSKTSGGNNVYPAWGDDTTWGYVGYFKNPSNQSVTYTFGKNFDDNGYLSLDGVTLIDDTTLDKPSDKNRYPDSGLALDRSPFRPRWRWRWPGRQFFWRPRHGLQQQWRRNLVCLRRPGQWKPARGPVGRQQSSACHHGLDHRRRLDVGPRRRQPANRLHGRLRPGRQRKCDQRQYPQPVRTDAQPYRWIEQLQRPDPRQRHAQPRHVGQWHASPRRQEQLQRTDDPHCRCAPGQRWRRPAIQLEPRLQRQPGAIRLRRRLAEQWRLQSFFGFRCRPGPVSVMERWRLRGPWRQADRHPRPGDGHQ